MEAKDGNSKVFIIKNLEKQLIQQRMTQESETCIQLIEGELNAATKEIQSLREQVKGASALRIQVEELSEELAVKNSDDWTFEGQSAVFTSRGR